MLRGRKAVRAEVKRDYRAIRSYEKVGLSWSISGGMAWKFVNEKNFWPTDKEIETRILVEASKRGIPLGNRGGRDLWSMSPQELLWRLINREEVNG